VAHLLSITNNLDVSGGGGTPVIGGTVGSVLFIGSGGVLAQDNSNFFWDDTANFLGLGIGAPTARLHIAGNISAAAWTTSGARLRLATGTYTDTSSSGTVALVAADSITAPTIAASSATTYTVASTLYIGGAPGAGANVTITNGYSMWVQTGDVAFQGRLRLAATNTGTTTSQLDIGGSAVSAEAWGAAGIAIRHRGNQFTDTSSSGTVGSAHTHSLGTCTFNASSVTTYTNAAALYISAAPAAGTNVTITNAYGLFIDAGDVRLDGKLICNSNANAPTAGLTAHSGAISAAAWGTAGIHTRFVGGTVTDTSTADGATVTNAVTNSITASTIQATNAATIITYTHAATLYVSAAPTPGTNITLTNPYSIWADAGDCRFDGSVGIGSSMSGSPSAILQVNGAKTQSAWTTNGIRIRVGTNTFTDTSSSGTVSTVAADSFGTATFAASSSTTYTNASSVYIAGAAIAGSNVTITSAWALDVNGATQIRTTLGIGNNVSGVVPRALLTLSGDVSSATAHTLGGQRIRATSRTYTDTASSGTVTSASVDGFATATIAASSSTTFTSYANVYIASGPTAGSNVTITHNYALWSDAGINRLDGNTMIACSGTPLAQFNLAGSAAMKRTGTATSYTILVTDYYIGVTSTAAARTITLPAASACFDSTNNVGMTFIVKDESNAAATNNITVTRAGSDTFTGGATSTVINTNGGVVWVMAISTTQWAII